MELQCFDYDIIKVMSNTVGNPSTNFCNFYENHDHAYVLELWCADGYHRSSSIGLSNINPELIERFRMFLVSLFISDRLRLRIYKPGTILKDSLNFGINKVSVLSSKKAKYVAYHVYVNNRPLLREFKKAKQAQKTFANCENGWAYIAGRFDGDGTIGKDLKRDLRISYTTFDDANKDVSLLNYLGLDPKIYRYETSHTFVIYIPRSGSRIFVENCLTHSVRLQKLVLGSCRDLPGPF